MHTAQHSTCVLREGESRPACSPGKARAVNLCGQTGELGEQQTCRGEEKKAQPAYTVGERARVSGVEVACVYA